MKRVRPDALPALADWAQSSGARLGAAARVGRGARSGIGTPPGLDNRSAVIVAAAGLFAEHGFDATSMDALAAAERVTKPTLYRYFDNKAALFAAALQSLLDQLPSPEEMILKRPGTLRERLIVVARDALRLGTGPLMASLHRMLSLPMESASYRAERFWDSNLQPYHDAMRRLLAAEVEAGTLDVAAAVDAFLRAYRSGSS